MARKLCTICNLRPIGSGRDAGYEEESFCRQQGYCLPCGNEGQHEISHDNGHESIPTNKCWICNPEMNEASADYKPRTGHTNTVAKTRGSHAHCTHERTPRARANCRKARVTLGAEVWTDYAYNARCTCGGNEDTDGPVLIHSHKCPLKGTDGKTEKIKRAEANMRRANAKVTVVSELPMPNLTPVQLASPVVQSMLRKRGV